MKRLFAAVLVIIVIGLACIYILIPKEIQFSTINIIEASDKAVYRSLADRNNWAKWWPTKTASTADQNKNEQYFNGYKYEPVTPSQNSLEVVIGNEKSSVKSLMLLLQLSPDSLAIRWSATEVTTANPFSRLGAYLKAKSLRADMQTIVVSLKSFAENGKNLYGVDIKQIKVTDTLLMVKKTVQKERPSIDHIYSYISEVRKYISDNNARETNQPMLHIDYKDDLKSYEVMVAVPVDRRLTGNARVIPKRMVAGNILLTEVKGGEATVQEAMKQMENYVDDRQKTSPALPYQMLITDRTKEADTTKWITKIYYPVL